ncbi:hypothetical protein C8D88_11880 [Lentzea atacamensis]|uniref:Uncharacterized protein n=2 Tax=Lentzea TaxID=165301 RepID=A0A316HMC4_9PSEU|nr:hypothetical protein [Lentzea atacamensis]PWK81312.1 hypothetical protein C8D88_11880 [Lentzea atacamensis]
MRLWGRPPPHTSMNLLNAIGPGGGAAGGRIIATGSPGRIAGVPDSATGRYLRDHLARAAT